MIKMKTNKLNSRSIRMKKAFRGLAVDSYAVSVSPVTTKDVGGRLEEKTLKSNNTKIFTFSPNIGASSIAKILSKYYIKFLLINSEGDKKYTDFLSVTYATGLVLLPNECEPIIQLISNTSYPVNDYQATYIYHTVNGFELYSNPDKKLIYPL
jgi:hypothetical protein